MGSVPGAHMNPAGFLVYVTDFSMRPSPQWWAELFYGADNQWRPRVLKSAPVAAEHVGKSLNELARLYPLEAAAP